LGDFECDSLVVLVVVQAESVVRLGLIVGLKILRRQAGLGQVAVYCSKA